MFNTVLYHGISAFLLIYNKENLYYTLIFYMNNTNFILGALGKPDK
jgi:hypothetical protein